MDEKQQIPAYVREHGPLEVPVRVVQLHDQIERLRATSEWLKGDRVAQTLVKEGRLRVVVMLLHAGARLQDHSAEGALTLQCLDGRLRFQTDTGHPIELLAGELAALDQGVVHSVEAVTDCAFMLTIAQ